MHLLKIIVCCTVLYCTITTGAFWAPELDLKEDDDGSKTKTLTLMYSVSEMDAREGGPNTCVGIARTATGLEGFPNNLTWEEDTGDNNPVTCIIGSDYDEEERSAIDPSVFWGMGDHSDRLFMVTGGGFIIGTELHPETYGQLDGASFEKDGEAWQELARGPIIKSSSSSSSGDAWVEAAYIHPNPKTGYYYIFVNWGTCCSGTDSTYQIRVGRSKNPMGPYLDKKGNNMMNGGGSRLVSGKGFMFGPGHTGIWNKGRKEYISFHYYDGRREGNSWIAEKRLKWKKGWPKTAKKTLNTFPRNMLG